MLLNRGLLIGLVLLIYSQKDTEDDFSVICLQDCKVLMKSISDTYDGECKKGLADGYGLARGSDTYEGNFKKGLPHGKGKYIWNNGDYYEGEWKKGRMEGNGKMVFKVVNNQDSIVAGFWEKGEYVDIFKVPYEVPNKSSNITKIEFSLLNEMSNEITFRFFSGKQLEIGEFVITPTEGMYSTFRNTGKSVEISGVQFPFQAYVNAPPYNFDFVIYKPGKWGIRLEVDLPFTY